MRNISSVCYARNHIIKVLLHRPVDLCRAASHDSLEDEINRWFIVCIIYIIHMHLYLQSAPFHQFQDQTLQANKVGLGRRDRLSGGRQGCFRAPITYALKNFSLTAIIQELLFAREGMRNRKRGNEESQMVD